MPGEKVVCESCWNVSQSDRADKLSGLGGEQIRDTQLGSAEDQLVASTKLTVPRPDSGETELSL